MSKIADRFNLASKNQNISVADIDFTPNKKYDGNFEDVFDIDVIINSWNNILLTPKGSYDHDPQYGSNLFSLLYEPMCIETEDTIRDDIYSSIYFYDNRATISDIRITVSNVTKSYNIKIEILYNGETKYLSLDVANLSG